MQIYLVGGAIRDQLLGLAVTERDWVVVGATPEQMLKLGYKAVGKDFPVFLHPNTHEEYALARTERKTGKGYKGFVFYANSDVSLADDLLRRDLTINAMAQDSDGNLIDPYGGQQDLQNKLFHHVSPAFAEDPVRILRVARLASKLCEFNIHPDTLQLMKNMVSAGEVNALVAERVWQELKRALPSICPQRFFAILQDCGALSVLFPEIAIDEELSELFATVCKATTNPVIRFASFFHLLSTEQIKQLARRLRIPNTYSDLTLLASKQRTAYQQLHTDNAQQLLDFILSADALRRPQRFTDLLMIYQCSMPNLSSHKATLNKALSIVEALSIEPLLKKNLAGKELADKIYQLRLSSIQKANS